MKTKILFFSLLLYLTCSITKAQNWEFVGLDSMVIKQLYVAGDSIWAGTAVRSGANINSGLYFTSNGGNNWIQLDSAFGSGVAVGMKYMGNGELFLIKGLSEGSLGGTLYKTTNNGSSWVEINYSIQYFGISPFNKNEIYAIDRGAIPGGTYNNLYKSVDGGENWQELGPFPGSSHGNELSFAFDQTDSMNLYVSVDDHFSNLYFFKSIDKGNNWFYISSPPVLPIDIDTDCIISDRIYLFPGPYISNEGGISWLLADSGLTDTSYHLSFYQDISTTQLLYNLRTDGLFYSKHNAFFWSKFENSENLPLVMGPTGFPYGRRNLKNVFVEPVSKELYVGTTAGIFKTSLITNVEEENVFELDYSLRQNYPNPFNPSTTIEYRINKSSVVSLKVYDILGNEIATLVNEEQSAGKYRITFNADTIEKSNLASGIYIYQLYNGTNLVSRKMTYLK
jgi:hypothetical protein